ncbi:UNVERIFIED_CONTAM: Retrovirus-related Pol polyprotein from transposon TNT 1-94 [Sesamum radiatum]|uniref:Retrovirus-related Pol polyprotein from transposon TNT 1-94 n=1 Tax=Sesamum radiatum TaxID=300843 RepID=A0AAW2M0G3_SESRA
MAESVKDMTTKFSKLDKFEGVDFRRWQKNMHFLLTTLKVVYVEDETVEQTRRRKFESAKALWDALEAKYMAEDASSKKFLDRRVTKTSDKKGKRKVHDNKHDGSKKKSKLICWKCGKFGKFKRDSHVGKDGNHFKNTNGASGSGEGSKDHGQNDDDVAWWIDSGATTHACKDRGWFKVFQPVDDGLVLHMGNESSAPIFGVGSVGSEFTSGKTISLSNVLYVPKLRKNLVFGSVLNKYGFREVFESDKYILSKSGVFVGFGYYNNGNKKYFVTFIDDASRVLNERNKVTLYELRYKKKPNLNYLRIWGCRGVVRLPEPKKKSLGERDEEIYMKQPKGFIMPANEHKQVDLTKEFLSSTFSMKDMGEADVILGIRIIRENKAISISQSHYIEKVLKKFNCFDCTPVSTPMDPSIKLMPNTREVVFQLEYSKVVGCLMYAMTSTRPDIAYAVGKLSRFTSNPSTHHWQAIRRVLKYLKKTMDYGSGGSTGGRSTGDQARWDLSATSTPRGQWRLDILGCGGPATVW